VMRECQTKPTRRVNRAMRMARLGRPPPQPSPGVRFGKLTAGRGRE
jgi:hypothetical protein